MTNEQLTAYLQDESYLYSLNYEELKSLVVQYPYAANLRVLLLKKAYIEQNKDYDRHLTMAAAYTTDRRFLYRAIKRLKTLQIIPENVILGEDYLELSALSDLDRVVKEKQTLEVPMTAETAKALSSGFILNFETPTYTQEDEEAMFDLVLTSKKDVDLENLSEADLDILVENLVHEFQPNDATLHELDTVEAKTELFEENLKNAETKDTNPILHLEDLLEANPKSGEDDIIDAAISTMNGAQKSQKMDAILGLMQSQNEIKTPLPEENQLIEQILSAPMPTPLSEDAKIDVDTETTFPNPIETGESVETIEFGNSVAPILEKEGIAEGKVEIIENISQYIENKSFITFTHNQQLFDKDEDDDMKKQDIELEIINQTKATIVGDEVVADTSAAPKVSFAEWLQQFKMVSVADKQQIPVAKVETPTVHTTPTKPTIKTTTTTIVRRTTITPQSNIVTELPTEESRIIQKETLAELFEKKDELPENLFNLPTETEMLDEAEYKGKIEAIFDDFLMQKPDKEVGLDIDIPQYIDNEAFVGDDKTLQEVENMSPMRHQAEGMTEGVAQINSILDMDDDDDEEDDELPPETKTKKLHEWAKQSIVEDDELVSETLANMYAKQGLYKKAIDMYERLSLQIPEKSNFFAAEIQKLRIKIISIF